MRMTIQRKRELTAGIGITSEAFEAYLRREKEKRKALKLMTPQQRRRFLEAEAVERARVAAISRAARMKRDGIDVFATRVEETHSSEPAAIAAAKSDRTDKI